jgi:heat-inducible transcriptional repressor
VKHDGEVIIEGTRRLLEQGAVDVQRMKGLLRALEEKELIAQLLEKTEHAEGLQVFIGAETRIDELSDFSVVAASYGPDEQPLGTLGVIGPNWMNYSKVIPLVDFTAELVSNAISGGRR